MIGNHRFGSQRNGKGRFAGVTLRAEAGAFEGVLWAPEVERFLQTEYGDDMAAGVADARRWHLERGGEDASITVMHVLFIICDLCPEAIRLAATAAAWKALGNAEEDLRFDKEGDCWVAAVD
jgi:hypothetical protein